jgi:hypothetical protein
VVGKKEPSKEAGKELTRQAGRQAGKEAPWGRLADKETDLEAGRLQGGIQAYKVGRYASKEAGKQLEQKIKKKTAEQKDINTILHKTKKTRVGNKNGGKCRAI